MDLEKTIWTYKYLKDEDLSNENMEIILNFFDKTKYEINANLCYSSFNVDLESYLTYPTPQEKDNPKSDIDNIFDLSNILILFRI